MKSDEKSVVKETPSQGVATPLQELATKRLSRRDLLSQAGQGALGLAMFALLGGGGAALAAPRTRLERLLPGAREIRPSGLGKPGTGPGRSALTLGDSLLALTPSLPMWGDGQNFDQPPYYETLCVGDVDGDGQDELVIRGPAGILVERFDPFTGQWMTLTTAGPPWADTTATTWWVLPYHYQTIQCVDVDGDGVDEIVGRANEGLEVYKYDNSSNKFLPLSISGAPFADGDVNRVWLYEQHYSTIKWGKNVKGNGLHFVVGRAPGGIVTYYYAEEVPGWFQPYFGYGPWPDNDSTNGTNWTLPQYYETIQFADVDGDGRDELLGRSASGLEIWKFDVTQSNWGKIYGGSLSDPTILSDAAGWNQPQYYQTIQFADIDGDGAAELIARAIGGIVALKFNTATGGFDALPNGPTWADGTIWDEEQYYSTIQFGDVDGDGAAEMIGRDEFGIQTFKYFSYGPEANTWQQIAGTDPHQQPAWTDDGTGADANGASWNEVQYYSTIQFAKTHPDSQSHRFPNPNTQPTHDGTGGPRSGPYATLIGRDKYGIQTWRYQQKDNQREDGGYWSRTSAPLPDFSSSADANLNAAYIALDTALRPKDHTGNFRDVYNNTKANFNGQDGYMGKLYPDLDSIDGPYQACTITAPAGIDDTAWQKVTWQIYWEMAYVNQVNGWFGLDGTKGLLNTITIGQILSVQNVGDLMSIPMSDNKTVVMSILSLVFNAGWAVLGFPGIAEADSEFAALPGQLSAISGILSTACSADATFGGAGASWQGAYSQLNLQLENAFSSAVSNNGALNYAITGGGTQTPYQPGDFGMIAAIGQQILGAGDYNPWTWPSTTDKVANQVAHNYAIQIWQTIIPASGWAFGYASDGSVSNPPYAYNYPKGNANSKYNPYWLAYKGPGIGEGNHYAPNQDQLFDTPTVGAIWPLGIPESDVFEAQNGWPALGYWDFANNTPLPPVGLNPPLRSRHAEVRVSVTLTRNASMGQLEATLQMENKGLSAATNLEFVSATLGDRSAIEPLPHHRTRLADGKKWTARIAFPANAGLAGQTVVLRVRGKYKGGTFGGSFRVKLP